MKKSRAILCHGVVILLMCFFVLSTAHCEEIIPLTVKDAAICLEVVGRVCVDPNDVFPSNVAKLSCFTRIFGAQEEIQITHVWFFGDMERARVPLNVHSVNFRTYSTKIIQPHEIGDWHVDVLGPGEKLLKTIKFEIVK